MKLLKYILALSIIVLSYSNSYSTTWTITASGVVFSPSSLNVTVGDTIKWQWIDGMHNTTSTSVPTGAAAWGAPLDVNDTIFKYKITVAGMYNYECTFHVAFNMFGSFTANPIGIKPLGNSVPAKYNLSQNYPNPFNPSTNIKFDVPRDVNVKLVIYDIVGNEQATLIDKEIRAGSYSVDWDASSYPSGVYFYKLTAPGFTATKKMILIK